MAAPASAVGALLGLPLTAPQPEAPPVTHGALGYLVPAGEERTIAAGEFAFVDRVLRVDGVLRLYGVTKDLT